MAVTTTTRKAGPFTGTGSADDFSFVFKIFDDAELTVIQTDDEAVETTLALTTDYTVALNADQETNPGGTVTLVAGNLASGYTLDIYSNVPETQTTELTNEGGFYPDVLNDALDKLTILVQQLRRDVDAIPVITEEGGAAVWGAIAGTLANQVDLAAALTAKVSTSLTVAGKALSGNITLASSDLTDSASLMTTSTALSMSQIPAGGSSTTFLRGDGSWITPSVSVGSVAWGAITGTLTDQSDLNTALSGKVATSRTVNGHALSSNVTVSASDVGNGTAQWNASKIQGKDAESGEPTTGDALIYNGTQWNHTALGTVATTNSYDDLDDKPTIVAVSGTNTWTGQQTIGTNDLNFSTAGKGIVLTDSTNGHTYRIYVDGGNLKLVQVT